jgi:hypothetical protein
LGVLEQRSEISGGRVRHRQLEGVRDELRDDAPSFSRQPRRATFVTTPGRDVIRDVMSATWRLKVQDENGAPRTDRTERTDGTKKGRGTPVTNGHSGSTTDIRKQPLSWPHVL